LPAVEALNQLIDRAPTEADDIARQQWLEAYVRWLIDNREACRVGLLDPGVRADPIVGPAVLDTRRRLFDLMRQFGAVDDAAARAAKGSLIYPVLIEGVNVPEIPRFAAAAIRALGAEMADRDL
jgi:hypothetical protein